MVVQCWYYWITQPTDRFIAFHGLFLVQIPLCRRRYFSSTGEGCGYGSTSMKRDSFVFPPGRFWLLWHMHIHHPLLWLKLFRGFWGRTKVKVSLMDLRPQLLFWISVCDFCILNECVCALWSSWLGWCQSGFCFHQGKAHWATWYPHCVLCISAEGMELHLQGCSRGNLWLLDSKPRSNIQHYGYVRPHPPPRPPHVPPPSYKSPGLSLRGRPPLRETPRRALVFGDVSDFRTWCHGPGAQFNYVHNANICHRCLLWEHTSKQTNKINHWQPSVQRAKEVGVATEMTHWWKSDSHFKFCWTVLAATYTHCKNDEGLPPMCVCVYLNSLMFEGI